MEELESWRLIQKSASASVYGFGTETRESLMEGISRMACKAGASLVWKLVRKMGGVDGFVGRDM